MKAVVVYDSVYGNCEKAAREIAKGCGAQAIRAGSAKAVSLETFDLLVVGSPTHGGKPMESVKKFLDGIPENCLKGKKAAGFDTHISKESKGMFLRGVSKVLGFAAPRISRELEEKGAKIAAEPAGFGVKGKEGPLEESELKKAGAWGAKLAKRTVNTGG